MACIRCQVEERCTTADPTPRLARGGQPERAAAAVALALILGGIVLSGLVRTTRMRRRSRLTRLGLTLATGAIGVAGSSGDGSGASVPGAPSTLSRQLGRRSAQNVSNCVGVTGRGGRPCARRSHFLIRCPAPTGFSVGGTDSRASSRRPRLVRRSARCSDRRASSQTSTGAGVLFHAVTAFEAGLL